MFDSDSLLLGVVVALVMSVILVISLYRLVMKNEGFAKGEGALEAKEGGGIAPRPAMKSTPMELSKSEAAEKVAFVSRGVGGQALSEAELRAASASLADEIQTVPDPSQRRREVWLG